jgi:hypothetical protein
LTHSPSSRFDPSLSIHATVNLTSIWKASGMLPKHHPRLWFYTRECRILVEKLEHSLGVKESQLIVSSPRHGTRVHTQISEAYQLHVRNLSNANTGKEIYFLRCEVTKIVKIGITGNINSRLTNLKVGSSTPLVLIGTIPGSSSMEHKIHAVFSKYRHHGEWFRLSLKTVLKFIESQRITLPFPD